MTINNRFASIQSRINQTDFQLLTKTRLWLYNINMILRISYYI